LKQTQVKNAGNFRASSGSCYVKFETIEFS